MKTILIFVISLFILSCNSEENQVNEFKDIYFDILKIREKEPDTAKANPLVRKLLNDYGYNEESFRQYSMELYSKNPQAFTAVIDSVRTKAEKDLLEYGKERQRLLDSTNKAKLKDTISNSNSR